MARITKIHKRWFPVPDDDEGAEVLVMHLKDGEVENINAEALRVVGVHDGEAMETEVDFKWDRRRESVILKCIVDWKGFFKTNKKPLPCNLAGKKKALKEFGWMEAFIDQCRATLKEEVLELEKAAAKN